MFKKLMPFVVMVFISACTHMQDSSVNHSGKMTCCEKCECCKSGKCGDCCKDGQCICCKDGMCKQCQDKHPGHVSSVKGAEECPMCAKAERERQAREGAIRH